MSRYVIVATFDTETETTLTGIIQEASTALELTEVSSNPHITLVSGPWEVGPGLAVAIKQLADRNAPIDIILPAAGLFLSEAGYLFLAPAFTAPLLQLRQQSLALASQAGLAVDPFSQPKHWLPHCSLLRGVKGEHLQRAAEVLQEHAFPISGRIEFLELFWVKPDSSTILGRWSLAKAEKM